MQQRLREGRSLDDPRLVERARRGDVDAYAEIVRRYQGLAFRTAYLVTGDPAVAEDAAQSAFVKAYYALGRFRTDAPLRPWLLKIVANEARNRRKAEGRQLGLALQTVDDRLSDSRNPSPEEAVLAQEELEELLDALDELREEDRLVVSYRYFLELSEGEMADLLGCPCGTVKSRLSRALERLRLALGGRRRRQVGHGFGQGAASE